MNLHSDQSRSAGADPLVEVKGLGIKRSGRWLLHDVDLSVAPGEILTVIGPNGGGKSTLIKAVLGLVQPDAGSVCHKPGISIGYVPQFMKRDPILPLTVARLMTLTRSFPKEEIVEALVRTGASHLIDQSVSGLSNGEFQRVLISRALLRKPDILVLDEPVQGVDFSGEAELYRLIGEIRQEFHTAVLLVSHDLHIVMGETDRVICINGHVCCAGMPREVAKHSEYRRLFGDRAVDAYAVYEHAHDHEHDLAGSVLDDEGHDHTHDHVHDHSHGSHA